MLTILDPLFWLSFLYFLTATFLAFYIPGNLIFKRFNLPRLSEITLSFGFGMILWAFQGSIFGYLELRWLTYIYLIICLLLYIKTNYKYINFKKLKLPKINLLLLFLILSGALLQIISVLFLSTKFENGIYVCCVNAWDSFLHVGYVMEIAQKFPPFEPGSHGVQVTNYHYWGHIVTAELVRTFNLPPFQATLQFMGVFLSLMLGLCAVSFAQILNLKKQFSYYLVFFLYFGGDLLYILTLIFQHRFDLKPDPIHTGPHLLENFPLAFSVIVFLIGLNLIALYAQSKNIKFAVIAGIVLGTIVGFKVNLVFIAIGGLYALTFYKLLKRDFSLIIPSLIATIISFGIFISVKGTEGSLIFTGFWRAQNYIANPDVGLGNMELARQVYIAHNNLIKIALYNLFFLILTIISIFGLKLLGLIQTKRSLSTFPSEINIFLIPGLLVSAILGLFFIQNPGGANSVFFLIAVYIVCSFYTALSCYYFIPKLNKKLGMIIIVAIIFLSLIRSVSQAYFNLVLINNREGINFSNSELEALDYLSKLDTEGKLIQVDPENFHDNISPYVRIYADKPVFLSGRLNVVEAHNLDKGRIPKVETIFYSTDSGKIKKTLVENNIGYLYLENDRNLVSTKAGTFFEIIFKNKEFKILKLKD